MKSLSFTSVLMILCATAFAQEPTPSPRAPAIPVVRRSHYVVVGGSVLEPQRVKWTAGSTLLQAISAAGGVSKSSTKVELTRNGKSTRYTIEELQNKREIVPEVLPGDRIVVD